MKKYLFVFSMLLMPLFLLAETDPTTATGWVAALTFLGGLVAWGPIVLKILGGLVVVGTAIDKSIPADSTNHFMSKVLSIPVVGTLLLALAKFSPFTYNEEKLTASKVANKTEVK